MKNSNSIKADIQAFADAVSSLHCSGLIGREILFFDSTGSTNDAAIKMAAEEDVPEGTVVVSDSQTGGRGRMGRSWVSPAGVNLYFTVLLRPALSPDEMPLLTLMTAVAAVSAIRGLTGVNAEIKWPNDIMVNGKKTGGILLDMKAGPDNVKFVAAGIGINVNMDKELLPEDIRPLSTSLKLESGLKINRAELLGGILDEMDNGYRSLVDGEKVLLLEKWRRMSSMIGEGISVMMHDKIISGIAEDIDDRGSLIVRLDSGESETVRAGDVTILKKS